MYVGGVGGLCTCVCVYTYPELFQSFQMRKLGREVDELKQKVANQEQELKVCGGSHCDGCG